MPAPHHPKPAAHPTQRFTVGPHTYSAVRMLGRYGVSERFLARADAAGEEGELVVLKRLQDTRRADDRERFLEEARLLNLLNHPSIPRVLAVASRAQRPLLAVEHVEGISLDRILNRAVRRRRPVPPLFAAYIAAQVADALHAAHSLTDTHGRPLHLVHRDVCPRNILLGAHGEVRLTDFGAAFTARPGRPVTRGMLVKGDSTYAAPEVLRHEQPDARADLFSLGLVLLELLTNRYLLDPPTERTPIQPTGRLAKLAHKLRAEELGWAPPAELAARAERILPEEVELTAAKVPSALRAIVQRALRPRPEDRHPSASAMRDDLRAFLAEQPPYGGRELVEDLRHLVATASGHRRDFEASREPIPAELRRKGTQRH